jgi:hypothetical protein
MTFLWDRFYKSSPTGLLGVLFLGRFRVFASLHWDRMGLFAWVVVVVVRATYLCM